MKQRIFVFLTIIVLAASISLAEDKEVSLFDGKSLEGWTQLNGTASYKVEDGTIIGRTEAGSPNSFLCSNIEYGDFILKFEVKCDNGLNSGVQVRSTQKTDGKPVKTTKTDKNMGNSFGRVNGPQVEIASSPGLAGFIYGEAAGGWLSPEPKGKDKAVSTHSLFKNDEWNKFEVIAKGNNIKTFINGKMVADLTHDESFKTHPKGFIGLQVHGIGNKEVSYKVAWRNITIIETPAK